MELIPVSTLDGEPRIRDIDLAQRLGFDRPRKIREIIERNIDEINSFGYAPQRGAHMEVSKPNGGIERRAVLEYWLNEEQALLVSVLSSAPNAPAVRAMLIRAFTAWRRSALPVPDTTVLIERLKPMIEAMVKQEIAAARTIRIGNSSEDGADRILRTIARYGGTATRAMIYQNLRSRYGVDELDWLLTTMARDGRLAVRPTRTGTGPGRLGVTYLAAP